MGKADLVGGILLALASLLLIFVIIPLGTESGQYYGLPPTSYPTVIASGLGLAAIGLIVQSLRQAKTNNSPPPVSRWQILMFLTVSAITVTGVIVIDIFGIWYGGPLLIGTFMAYLGERNLIRIGLTAIIPVAILSVLASHVLHTPLP